MKDFIKIILRGVGQVMFQNNAISGFIFLSGIFYNSWIMGIFAILGNLISTFFAYLFGYDKNDIQNGLYGFNGTLVGISLFFYFGFNYISIIALIFTSILSSVFMHEIKKRFPAFTSPFVFSVKRVLSTR